MALSWNEITHRAVAFSAEWEGETRENAEAKSFWDAFFGVFGINRRRFATFEKAVDLLGDKRGSIDLFWKGLLLVEHKSRGRSLDAAFSQAVGYFQGIDDDDLPKYVLVSDFARFRLYDLDNTDSPPIEFGLEELHSRVHHFGFLLGYEQRKHSDEAPANIKAAKLMGSLHEVLEEGGYSGHELELLLVRVLFCLFADDTGIFEKDAFRFYLEEKTKIDGTDLGIHLNAICATLDTPHGARQKALDEELLAFPYVNGTLFKERIEAPAFDARSRETLLKCARYDWSKVSPAVFGSLFQVAMDPEERHYLGAHYTAEANILKAIGPLFLDELAKEAEAARRTKHLLEALLGRIARLRLFDPACGCGTFLIVAYRELRELELKIFSYLREISGGQESFGVDFTKSINVDRMYGIEVEELPARIAETALWVVDHQMNLRASEMFGQYFTRLPLVTSPNIRHGNALQLDWRQVVPPIPARPGTIKPEPSLTYVIGNPPFAGKKRRTASQNADMATVCAGIKGSGVLDYVSCWYIKAAEFIRGTDMEVALVGTNSITQGEQVGLLWGHLLAKGVHINFAHRTFQWTNDAGGRAQVQVVIVGFGMKSRPSKVLYDYPDPAGQPVVRQAKVINPYLVDGASVLLAKRRTSVCGAPAISFGSMPNDGGNLLMTDPERAALLASDPKASAWVKRLLTADEVLNGKNRWCLWLEGIKPNELRSLPGVMRRVEAVRAHRERSTRPATKLLASSPSLFAERRQPKSAYLLIPRHSSEGRKYIPMSLGVPADIVGDSCIWVGSSDAYECGVVMSDMHMAWIRQVCGRIESRFRYSVEIVYNNFPWPKAPTAAQRQAVALATQAVWGVRAGLSGSSLAEIYDPLATPPELVKAHKSLDRAVEKCYRAKPFPSDLARLEYLFELYEDYAVPLGRTTRKRKPKKKAGTP